MTGRPRVSARLRLALGYAGFLVAAGLVTLVGVYVVLRYVPNYPLTAANPRDVGPVATRGEILDAVLGVSWVVLGTLAVIGVAGGWWLAGRVLAPLRHINEAARIAATGRLDHRIRLTGRNDEFRQVADTFDLMLDRLHDAFTAHERFAANAAHELRTPLAVTATMLDVARRDPGGQDYPVLVERLGLTNARAIGLTEALLRLADANAVTAVAEPVDLATLTRDAVTAGAAEAAGRQVSYEVALAAAPMHGDATLLGQLAANLVQNAVRHNLTPGTAWIRTCREPGTVRLHVENTGARYTTEAATQLTEPFLRGAGRVGRDPTRTDGYGLGLALVARITEVHHGTLTITPRDGGGLLVEVSFPAPGADFV